MLLLLANKHRHSTQPRMALVLADVMLSSSSSWSQRGSLRSRRRRVFSSSSSSPCLLLSFYVEYLLGLLFFAKVPPLVTRDPHLSTQRPKREGRGGLGPAGGPEPEPFSLSLKSSGIQENHKILAIQQHANITQQNRKNNTE